jgi:DNA-binding response OmpR family regulator
MRTDPLLIVSRDARLQDTLVAGCRSARVPAVSADGAAGAVTLLREQPFRCVVVDVEQAADWPGCDAISAAALVAGVPVILVTAWTAPEGRYRSRAFNSGCAAFIRKPCSIDTLLRTVERLDRGERQVEVLGAPH